MTDEEKALLKKKIEQKLKYLNEDIADLVEQTKPIAPENSLGRVSRMDAINNKSVNEASLRQAKSKKAGLERALTEIDHPNFGKCTTCGAEIPYQRILLVPESPQCINCSGKF